MMIKAAFGGPMNVIVCDSRGPPSLPLSPSSLPSIHYGRVTFIGVEAAGIPVAGYKIGTHASVSRSNPERQERPPCIGSAD